MKKFVSILLALIVLCLPVFTAACDKEDDGEYSGIVLRVYNWEDYIGEDVIENFEEETGIKIEYSTFGTNEDMYNSFKINPKAYDLMCPSDYMIQKLAVEGLIRKLDRERLDVYNDTASEYLINELESVSWDSDEAEVSLADYAIGYMWGTLGIIYNADALTELNPDFSDEELTTWGVLWDETYDNTMTIKDSVRDSYFIALAVVYKEELDDLAEKFNEGILTEDMYKDALAELFNRTDDETIDKAGEQLRAIKSNLYGFEVDSGKNDIASGRIYLNHSWSGDAVFAMDEADEMDVTLYYAVPNEGSNIWFDGWCVAKDVPDSKMDAVYAFINYLSLPSVAEANMEYVGYTSFITGEYEEDGEENSIFDWVIDYFELETDETLLDYELICEEEDGGLTYTVPEHYEEDEETGEEVLVEAEDVTFYKVDLSYLFGEDSVLYTDEVGRQFFAQYPPEDVVARCTVMQYFDDATNTKINNMWESVKGYSLPAWAIVTILFVSAAVIAVIVVIVKNSQNFYGKGEKRVKKGVKIISKENL